MSKVLSLFFVCIILAAAIIPALAVPVPGHFTVHSVAHAKRLVDYDCTFLPEGQKPARCASGQPLIPQPANGLFKTVSHREIEPLISKRAHASSLLAARALIENVRRIVDIQCTFLPADQRPARCSQPSPSNQFGNILRRSGLRRKSTNNMKRILDYQCTFLPENQKPARCSQPPPTNNGPLHVVSF